MAAHCRLSLLELGRLDVDDGFFIRGATRRRPVQPASSLRAPPGRGRRSGLHWLIGFEGDESD